MPTRVTYAELKEVLGDKAAEADKLFKGEPETALIASILWAFEVPSEAFRLGRTRVFFRAGQISTVQKILNETGPEKAPWIMKRLKDALASRQEAKAAAEEAQAAMSAAKAGLKKAEYAAEAVLGPRGGVDSSDEDSDDGVRLRHRLVLTSSSSSSGVKEDDLRGLESAAKKAKTAGSTLPQIDAMVGAAREDNMGTYAEGLMDRVLAASKDAIAKVKDAAAKGADLEKAVADVRGRDEATALRRLGELLRGLHTDFKAARRTAESAMEAAAKCQVDKTRELTDASKAQATKVEGKAREVANVARGAAQASERQRAAFEAAQSKAKDADTAAEKAKTAFSIYQEATDEEEVARVAALKKAEEANKNKQKETETMAEAAAAAAAAAASAAEVEAEASGVKPPAAPTPEEQQQGENKVSELVVIPSAAPANRRLSAISRVPSMSVKNLLDSDAVKSPVPSPTASPDISVSGLGAGVEMIDGPRAGGMPIHMRSTSERVEEAMADGYKEGYLMSQSKMMKRWTPRYFVLDNGFLSHYENISLVGTKKHKTMELKADSVTRPANQINTFGVRTGTTEWLLLARSKNEMKAWMGAIKDQIHALFIREYNVPGDDYQSQGAWGQCFYKMVAGVRPQWIRTFPVPQAPHTGDGLFEGETIEVTQVLENEGVSFLRMANDRGWASAQDIEAGDGTALFTKVSGELTTETREHIVPMIANQPAVVLFGPSLESQEMGATLMPGDIVRVVQRYTPAPGVEKRDGQTFVKLKKTGGWVPIMKSNGVVGVVPHNPRG
ncbi:unnamed protein product [Ectocarpus sp. CCAP 1310/34]|nr:unnamed protein product [Ectocarpus sp. CCAP 1310/34]